MESTLLDYSRKAVLWSAVERFSVQLMQFIISILLARLVAPSEYGLVAMLTIFISIAQTFVDSGFSSALIQKKNVTEIDYNTVFYFSVLIAIILYLILFLCSSYIALHYKLPLLESLCRWMGLTLIFQALSVVQITKLSLLVDFRTLTKASLSSVSISGALSVFMAFNGFGIWALITHTLLSNLLNTVFLFWLEKWRPKLLFSWESLKSVYSFGSKLLMSGLLHSLYINLYNFAIGSKYNPMDLGYYSQSSQIARLPSVSLMAMISRAIYPIQCKLKNEGRSQLEHSYIQYLRMSCYIIFPIMMGLAVLSKPLILVLLTAKWINMAPYLLILGIAYMFNPMMVMNNQILLVYGRTDYFFKAEILKKILGISIMIITLQYGVVMMCVGILVYNVIDIVITTFFSVKVCGVSLLTQIEAIFSIFSLVVSMGVIMSVSLFFINSPYLQLIVGGLIGCVYYLSASRLFKFKEYVELLKIVKSTGASRLLS